MQEAEGGEGHPRRVLHEPTVVIVIHSFMQGMGNRVSETRTNRGAWRGAIGESTRTDLAADRLPPMEEAWGGEGV